MTTNQLPPFEKVFGWLGLQDDDKYYKAAAALPAGVHPPARHPRLRPEP